MAIEIVDFPSYKMVDLSIAMLNYQRVHSPPSSQILEAPCAHFASDAVVGLRRPQVTFAEATGDSTNEDGILPTRISDETNTLSKTGGSKCKDVQRTLWIYNLCWKMD